MSRTLALAYLRREFLEPGTRVTVARGAVARASHDVPGWGLGYGRLKSVMTNGGGAFTGVTLDAEVPEKDSGPATFADGGSKDGKESDPAGEVCITNHANEMS